MALDTNVFSNLRPVEAPDILKPYQTMMALRTQQLQQQDIGEQIEERRQAALRQQIQNQKTQQIAGIIHQHVQNGGKIDDSDPNWPALRSQIYSIDPTAGQNLDAAQENLKKTRAETKNFESEAANRETPAERAQRFMMQNTPPAEREYQIWRTVANLPDTLDTRNQYKVQGTKLSPGEIIAGAPGQPPLASAPEKPPNEYDQKLAAFNADPFLVGKFGKGPNGLAAKEQADRIATSAAQGAAAIQRANGNDPRLADVAPSVHKDAIDSYKKANEKYITAQEATDTVNAFLNEAAKGNKEAYAYAPVAGVLQINVGGQIKRINRQEIEAYAGAGSLFDRIVGALGKQVSGASISSSVLADMKQLHAVLAGNARTAYEREIRSVNSAFRSKFEPMDFSAPTIKPGFSIVR